MDGREQEQRLNWLMSQRISRSPSPYTPEQAASPPAETSGDQSSIQGTMEGQPSSQDQSRAGETSHHRWDWTRQHSGAGSETPRTKRRRRSSSLDQGGQREARGRDDHLPPARRQKIATKSENNWIPPASSSLAAETRISRQISRSLSPQRYRTSEGGPSRQGGEQPDRAPFDRSSWIPPDIPSDKDREDVSMRSASPPCLPQVEEERGSGNEHDHSPLGSPEWGVSQDREGSRRHPVQEPVMETLSNNPAYSEGSHQASPPTQSYGPTYNIASAVNVFTGINNGYVYMGSDSIQSTNDFMRSLPDLLKICFRADHLYHASGDEAALRRGQCTQGTRIDIIGGVLHWATNGSPSSEIVYWLSGQAGAGKTTIAYTIACQLETTINSDNGKAILGGSFFCSRQFLDTRSASSIIPTIVYQLVLRSMLFRDALKAHGRFETVTHGPRSQLMGLLVEPWIRCQPERRVKGEPCYVLPIDALDELEGVGGVEFLSTLFDIVYKHDLSGLKFFITSRSEPVLVKQIKSFTNKQICRLEEVPLNQSSADIKLYLNENLAQCTTPQQIQQLVLDAAGLFIYAATVVEYMKERSIEEQQDLLKRLLSTSPPSHRHPRNATTMLDSLYLQILETCLVNRRDRGDPDVFQDCLSVLHTFLCTSERTSASVAVSILQEGSEQSEINNGTAEGVLLRLHAVLYVQDGLVMSYHKSFSDFLFDQHRSKEFYCNQERLHHCLASGCLGIMARQLRFNIANIPTSYQMDNDNPALLMRIDTNISTPLRYACRNWSVHLILTPFEALDGYAGLMHEFLQLRILFWMESMNLLGQRGWCQRMLRDAQQWFLKSKGPIELAGMLADGAAFAAYHNASKAALSTPHLYLSSLATFSRHSTIVQDWRKQFGSIPGFIRAYGTHGEALVASIPLRSKVNTLAVSPDSVNIAVGSCDGLVRVLNLSTGEEVRVLRGHTNWVCAVAYSPDGSHVVSGSGDTSIRLWDVSTGEEVRVLKGHTNWVRSVAYLPDGSHIVSRAADNSIRVWDVSTGEEVRVLAKGYTPWIHATAYSPDGSHIVSDTTSNKSIQVLDVSTGEVVKVLKGHTDFVRGVAYSPDGSHVVSGSDDKSIRVWDVATGNEVRVFKGHTNYVHAVAYSPDGSHVVSGSDDKSIRVWDVDTGEEVRVLKGHTSRVSAVAYLPDGSHVVSVSDDQSIQVWDVAIREGEKVLEGHTDRVCAVAYSPDGSHVVSGSADKSIRVWDVSTGEEVRVLKGHTNWVRAVAYSLDGSHVVSGSDDKSIRVWDVDTGEEVRVLKGHTNWVSAVAYSPDGSHVVSGSDDQSVRVWDVSTGKEVRVLEGHTNSVSSVAYSQDGNHVVSGSDNNSIQVWDVFTGEVVKVLQGHTGFVRSVAYSPDGSHVVSGSGDKSIQVWDVSPEYTPYYIREQDPNRQYTGWLVLPADPSAYLMYVRPEALLPDASNILTMPISAVSHLDLSNAKLGASWVECYTPRPF